MIVTWIVKFATCAKIEFMKNGFNKIDRRTRITSKVDRVAAILKGVNVDAFSTELAQYAWTGRAWVCWYQGKVLGFSQKHCNPGWFNDLCRFLNKDDRGEFKINLGKKEPRRSFYVDKQTDDIDYGVVGSESKPDHLKELLLFFDTLK
jgi:hypothetical protein